MSKLKSLEKLRGFMLCKVGDSCNVYEPSYSLADEIEREIAERYMELPVDADGEPIHIGDLIEYHDRDGAYRLHAQGVYVYSDGRLCGETYVMNERLGIWEPDKCSHIKPRTLEDVLKELACDVRREWVENAPLAEHVYSEYADEIRELIGGSE